MARTQTMVQLNDELLGLLDAESLRRGVSRSALIREAVENLLHDAREAQIVRQLVEGYKQHPRIKPDEWGDLETQSVRNTRETMRRLDEEEREAGLQPW